MLLRKNYRSAYRRHVLHACFCFGLLYVIGCPSSSGPCEADSDCGDGRFCEVETGVCLCQVNSACADLEFCNPAGYCQAISDCRSNEDCVTDRDGCENQFCDVVTAKCVSVCLCEPEEDEQCCTLDSHCNFGEVCVPVEQKCRPGCRTAGDCPISLGCQIEEGETIGGCVETCFENFQCQYGEFCDLERGQCVEDTRGPFCGSCSGGLAGDCGAEPNFCLLNPRDPFARNQYCGVDCSQGQSCPLGFSCSDVILLDRAVLPVCVPPENCIADNNGARRCEHHPEIACEESTDCPEGALGSDCPKAATSCDAGSQCPGGSVCPDNGKCPPYGNCLQGGEACEQDRDCCEGDDCPLGSCVLQLCQSDEGDEFGVCTCTEDSDCSTDTCEGADFSDPESPVLGTCVITGQPCSGDIDCGDIQCVNGGCRVGQNCTPSSDRSCSEILGAES